MAFVDQYVAEILRLEVALFHAKARLEAESDDEALHDLRIAVRKIRSLLIPVRALTGMNVLREAAANVGRLTTPARDLEVMAGELETRGLPGPAASRLTRLKADRRAILGHPGMQALFAALDLWPATFRASPLGKDSKLFKRAVVKSLNKHVDKLHIALDDPRFDRHELRILVKRTRYLTEAFPKLSPLSKKAAKSLKAVQGALGSWHDHHQWCLKVAVEADLAPLENTWKQASTEEMAQAETEMLKLKALLPKLVKKPKPAAVAVKVDPASLAPGKTPS
jgi:CHAD domain-containing protein